MTDSRSSSRRGQDQARIEYKGYVPRKVTGGHQPQTTGHNTSPPTGGSAVKPAKK